MDGHVFPVEHLYLHGSPGPGARYRTPLHCLYMCGSATHPGGGIMGAMDRRKAWQRRLNEGRWAAINWPREWGGMGLPTRVATACMEFWTSACMSFALGPVLGGVLVATGGEVEQVAEVEIDYRNVLDGGDRNSNVRAG